MTRIRSGRAEATGAGRTARAVLASMAAALALAAASGCGGHLLEGFDAIALDQVLDRGRAGRAGLGPGLRGFLEDALAGIDVLDAPEDPRNPDESTVVVDAEPVFDDDGTAPAAVSYAFKTGWGAPLFRALLVNPEGAGARRSPAAAAALFSAFVRKARLDGPDRAGEDLVASGSAGGVAVLDADDAPGRFGAWSSIGLLIVGGGDAGLGRGAPEYDDIFGRGMCFESGVRLGLNGYLDAFLSFVYSSCEGLGYSAGDLTLKFEDFAAPGLCAGVSARMPIAVSSPSRLLRRWLPPFPDTRGIWAVARAAGGISWIPRVDASVLSGGTAAGPGPEEGSTIRYFRAGEAFFAEFSAGIEIRTVDSSGVMVSFMIDAGIRVGEAPAEGAGRASEGGSIILVPVRASISLSF